MSLTRATTVSGMLSALLVMVSFAAACAPSEVREVGPPPGEALDEEVLTEPPICDASTRQDIEQTVDGQLAAFARRDFEAALEFAAPVFREAGVESFRILVEQSFPELLDAATHKVGVCTAGASQAFATIEVVTRSGSTAAFQYLFDRDPDRRWRIGAVIPQDENPPAGTTV